MLTYIKRAVTVRKWLNENHEVWLPAKMTCKEVEKLLGYRYYRTGLVKRCSYKLESGKFVLEGEEQDENEEDV